MADRVLSPLSTGGTGKGSGRIADGSGDEAGRRVTAPAPSASQHHRGWESATVAAHLMAAGHGHLCLSNHRDAIETLRALGRAAIRFNSGLV
jgi:hypothetical protein